MIAQRLGRDRCPRKGRAPKKPKIHADLGISNRPEIIADRVQFGHWESDLMLFRQKFGKANVTSLVERVSRFTVLLMNTNKTTASMMGRLATVMRTLPHKARRSITFDRGTEFLVWKHLRVGIGADAWFCDPQAPHQKGTVENTNNRLRRYLPGSTEPMTLTNRCLRSICHHLNATPRKCLGCQTPAEIFETKLMEIQNRLEKQRHIRNSTSA
ncbi:MAG: IS30 family transposase [Pseudomonadota bacterium]